MSLKPLFRYFPPWKNFGDAPDVVAIKARLAEARREATTPRNESSLPASINPYDPWAHPVECVIKMARTEPDALCINTYESGDSVRYSYLQVWQRAYSISEGLKTLPGWHDDDHEVVGIFCETEAHWLFFSLALWMLGKKTLNFALNLPPAVRKELATRHGVKYLLYHHTKPGRTEGVVLLDGATLLLSDTIPPPSLEVCGPLDEFVAYICTSGQAGVPESFKFSHTNCISDRDSIMSVYSRVGLTQPPSCAATLWYALAGLNLRGSLWFPTPTPNPVHKAQSVISMLNDGLQFTFMPPAFMRMMMGVAVSQNAAVRWKNVRRASLGLEMVPPTVIFQAKKLCPNAEVQSIYSSCEMALIGAAAYFRLPADDPVTPAKLIYKVTKPGIRCLLLDEEGNIVDRRKSDEGILVFAADKHHPARYHPDFINSDPNNKLAPFGFLSDGSPRVCTMDWVEMKSDKEFVVIGRYDQKIKVNGVYVDLNYLEKLVLERFPNNFAECMFVQTYEKRIIMMYTPRHKNPPRPVPIDTLLMTQELFITMNAPRFPIHNCFIMDFIPMTDTGKRDRKTIKRMAENADMYGRCVVYPEIITHQSALTRIASKVAVIGSHILGASMLGGRNYHIAGASFDSMSAARFSMALKDEFDVQLSPAILLSNGVTPLDIAQLITDIYEKQPLMPPATDFNQEVASLDDPSVTAEGFPPFVYPKDPRGIVITGATGFLGVFLVYELAEKFPHARIYCLVRETHPLDAAGRVLESAYRLILAARQKGNPKYYISARLEGLPGDLSKENWGLSPGMWKRVCEETDMIVHCGAQVHWNHSYDKLKEPNVLGTMTALRLATTHHLKPLHFISTISVIPMTRTATEPLKERMYPTWSVSSGYAQTKWVAEQLIYNARSRGVPATIIRPSMVAGDTVYGVCNTDDFFWRYIKGCMHFGIAPAYASPVMIPIDPVDYVARVIAEIVASDESISKFVFHISDSENSIMTEKRLFEILNAKGWVVRFDTREMFKGRLEANPSPESKGMTPLLNTMMDMSFKVDNTNTRSIFPIPGPSAEITFIKCLTYLYRFGYLPAPVKPLIPERPQEYPELDIFAHSGRR
ncbi:male sterility protein-domain-containing protein [Polychytrium aggregatum]|uniref:male sterility protein-domain-containing protein n=1 Tax=Polychytrium aggregatum TaxID=110093 RepID=UPI0022FEF7FB|nr:male sterility protein-domain-containing protein [Polychytrium aggregatum]KAI9203449.1 male sterility protein-domain-containing protein [Polychytrium aggregatum]